MANNNYIHFNRGDIYHLIWKLSGEIPYTPEHAGGYSVRFFVTVIICMCARAHTTDWNQSWQIYSETCVLRLPHGPTKSGFYITGGLLSELQICRNVGLCSYSSGLIWHVVSHHSGLKTQVSLTRIFQYKDKNFPSMPIWIVTKFLSKSTTCTRKQLRWIFTFSIKTLHSMIQWSLVMYEHCIGIMSCCFYGVWLKKIQHSLFYKKIYFETPEFS